MNERIKKLADKIWSLDIEPNPHFQLCLQSFAESIVQECIETITEYDLVLGHSAKWEDIYDIHARLLQDLGEELKEHFGVEL